MFETVRTINADGKTTDSKRFKILHDPNIMEDLDLETLASESRRAIDTAKDASDHNRDHNVAVIKKVPVIAVKYPMAGGQVKRFQIRFTCDADFYEALKQLANNGVHMLEAGTFPTIRPQTAQQTFTQPPNQLPQCPTTAAGVMQAAASGPAPGEIESRYSNISLMQPPPPCDHYQTVGRDTQYAQPRDNALRSQIPPSAQADTGHTVLQSAANQNVSRFPEAGTGEPQAEPTIQTLVSRPAAIDLYTPRPSTAPAQVSQHLSQLLPPKRELPFKQHNTGARAGLEPVNSMDPSARDQTGQISAVEMMKGTAPNFDTIIPNSQELECQPPAKKTRVTRSKAASRSQPSKTQTKEPTKKAAAPKPAGKCDACKSRGSRTRCNHKQQSPPLPSIEEVFEPKKQKAATEVVDNDIDTQALLGRAATTKKRTARKPPARKREMSEQPDTTRVTRSMSVAGKATRPDNTEANRARAEDNPDDQKPVGAFPCTPAEQLIHPATPRSPTANVVIDKSPQPAPAPSRSQAQVEVEATYEEVLEDFSSVLDSYPQFANADKKLAGFASLSSVARKQVLEQWCIQQYKSKDFRVLCRAMDASVSSQLALTL